MSDDYEERRAQRRDEERKFERDVAYEVWRNGGDMDRINPDRIQDHRQQGWNVEATRSELRAQRPKEPEIDMDQQFPPDEFPPEECA